MPEENLKCDHCAKTLKGSISLIARFTKDGKLRHDFCSLKCTRLWILSEEALVTVEEALKEKQEEAKQPLPSKPLEIPFSSAPSVIEMSDPTPAKLAKALGIKTPQVIAELMNRNCFATAGTAIFLSDAAAVCRNHGATFLERTADVR